MDHQTRVRNITKGARPVTVTNLAKNFSLPGPPHFLARQIERERAPGPRAPDAVLNDSAAGALCCASLFSSPLGR